MDRRKLTVHRQAYTRRSYVKSDGAKVKKARIPAADYKVKDRGNPGRGTKVIPKLKSGSLGKGYFSKTDRVRHTILKNKGSKIGEKRLAGKLRAIQVLNKNINKSVSRKAAADAKWVYSHFDNKKYKR